MPNFEYAELNRDDRIVGTMALTRRPDDSEIKKIDGKPLLRPIEDGDRPHVDENLYSIEGPTMTVEPTRVVRSYRAVLRADYKQRMTTSINLLAQSARNKISADSEMTGTGLIVKLMKDEEAQEFLSLADAPDEASFPMIYAGVGLAAETPFLVAAAYRAEMLEIKRRIAGIERSKLLALASLEKAATPEAAAAAFDGRDAVLKQ